ncbi:MAG: type IV pilus assembly protein PilM, partial [Planctomycetota bacterium]
MPKNNSAWGIEIGAFAIKAIRLEREGDEVLVKDFAYIPHAKPLTTPEIDVTEVTRLTLQQFVTAKNLEDSPVVVSVPGHVGLARFAKLPPVEPKKIPDIVKFEAVQQIPFPIEEVEWDYQTFASDDNPEVEVGIFAITKQKIAERLGLYAEFGIRPEIVTLGSMAVFNAMTYDLALGEQHKPAVFLDIGTQATDVVVAENGRCWIRSFAIGGTHFTEALAESFKVNYTKADRLKAESASSKYARQMMQAMRPVFGDLLTDVQRSIGSYQKSHREHPVEQAWGVGSTFRIPGLRKFLGQQLNVDVQRVDEFKRIRVEGRDAADFAANSVNMVTAYGLALQGVGLARIAVNLSPVGNLREKLWQAKTKWFVAAASVA